MLLTPQISYGAKGTIHFWILVLAVLLVEAMLFIHTYQLITMTQIGEKYLHNCFLELLFEICLSFTSPSRMSGIEQ